ncbi:hypothetical protein Hamer_G031251 [Homarus americanus]|uniref:Uncharacterized protein n=1 Tax=Homarus americanus TaxID=6706 RepID=A0A8J5MXX8_HOMAM|nr:hypothetical protein Hamer_G027402 [Homarus americanus]KAG7162015.1 hypothetical protein Hamer_G027924 [Homarus americanus]KAG7165200.1 hypothetical protein Hamer_G028687 [Homarus americanus]KAG7167676.1 hypothetical protein Hamer_G027753 [Homarus americanus]KAG7177883.1 hypothetical protein Hamer_G031251 [Homarus americanus]
MTASGLGPNPTPPETRSSEASVSVLADRRNIIPIKTLHCMASLPYNESPNLLYQTFTCLKRLAQTHPPRQKRGLQSTTLVTAEEPRARSVGVKPERSFNRGLWFRRKMPFLSFCNVKARPPNFSHGNRRTRPPADALWVPRHPNKPT